MAHSEDKMQRYVQWDVRNWSRGLAYWTSLCEPSTFEGAKVLEVGARDGGLTQWFLDQGASGVVCSDVNGPSEIARHLHAEAGVNDRVDYVSLDATSMDYHESFDIVAFKSVLGGIGVAGGLEAQARAVHNMHRALRPGGVLLFAENLVASPIHAALRRRFVSWGSRWRYVTTLEMSSFLEPFGEVQQRTLGFAGAFGRSEKQRSALARVDVAGLDRIVPPSWRYIEVGVARK